ncbi:MAG: N-acetylmuramoyl-L-alanine amidase [Betaproteobacteria bacterium]
MKIRSNKLVGEAGENISFQKSPNQSEPFAPIYLLLHYTAGTTLDGAVSWFMNPAAQASSHIVIGRDGRIVQMVAFNKKAWHAGDSAWGNLKGMNQYAIGIELVNAGKLRNRPDGKWADWSNHVLPDSEVTIAVHKDESTQAGWHEYSEVQIRTAIRVASLLRASYQIADVLGHEDVSRGRKTDPGPLFPMNSFRSIVMGRA